MGRLVSVVIPIYNCQFPVKKILGYVFDQSYKDVEVIIVDDGSNPPVSLPSEFGAKVRLISQENMGAPAARNRGAYQAKGDYIIFWDADIMPKKTFLQALVQALEDNLQASYAYCNYYFGLKEMKAQKFNPEKLKENNYIHTSSLIRKKDLVSWDEDLYRLQDWDLWLTMLEQRKVGVWVDQGLYYIVGRGTMSFWLPKFAYKKPWKFLPGIKKRVEDYEKAREIIFKKH